MIGSLAQSTLDIQRDETVRDKQLPSHVKCAIIGEGRHRLLNPVLPSQVWLKEYYTVGTQRIDFCIQLVCGWTNTHYKFGPQHLALTKLYHRSL